MKASILYKVLEKKSGLMLLFSTFVCVDVRKTI